VSDVHTPSGRFRSPLDQAAALLRADKPSPKNTAANTRKTAPIPDESRVKSTMATIRNVIPAKTFPSACLDTESTLLTGRRFVALARALPAHSTSRQTWLHR
jgi:hypothetical protein